MKGEPKYDRFSKTISLVYNFSTFQDIAFNIKLKASREAWFRALKFDFDRLTFADVKPFLSRNRKKRVDALEAIAAEDPDHFAAAFLDCVLVANSQNPLFRPARKTRGGSPYDIDLEAVKTAARQLYVHLRFLKAGKPRGWRDKLSFIERKYKVSCSDLRPVVMKIVKRELGFKLAARADSYADPCHFYRKFIHKPGLFERMKKSTRIKAGETPFIARIFS